jgi:hypothetical protein
MIFLDFSGGLLALMGGPRHAPQALRVLAMASRLSFARLPEIGRAAPRIVALYRTL